MQNIKYPTPTNAIPGPNCFSRDFVMMLAMPMYIKPIHQIMVCLKRKKILGIESFAQVNRNILESDGDRNDLNSKPTNVEL